MSLGSLDVARSALGAALSLLLCASIIQGLRNDIEMAHYETTEAAVGQNVTLLCTVKHHPRLRIVSIEWRKNMIGNPKLALFSQGHGVHLFWPNVTIDIEKNHANKSTGSYLHLLEVKKWDGGIYICDVATFPFGSIRRETELKIKDAVELMCDVGQSVDIRNGENVTIRCRASPQAQYRWTKNMELVSETESLELLWVTDAHAGVYTLTVDIGKESMHKEFTITVQTATTGLQTDPTTVSPQSNVTEEGFLKPAGHNLTTSPTTGHSTSIPSVTWTTAVAGTDATDAHVTATAGERVTSFTSPAHSSVTSSPAAAHTEPNHSTALSPGSTVYRTTQEMAGDETRNESTPGATQTLKTGNGIAIPGGVISGALIVVPVLVLIAVAGLLYRRRIIKQRMALPPPFKPPPPPVKIQRNATNVSQCITHNGVF
uniref:Ig-like domain-containing protein n=1 Tax=Scophthalmus maximus TaxID=52904 RepID=A0A8D3BK81_SCOMX